MQKQDSVNTPTGLCECDRQDSVNHISGSFRRTGLAKSNAEIHPTYAPLPPSGLVARAPLPPIPPVLPICINPLSVPYAGLK